MTMHVKIDQSLCCGSGMCVLNVPEVFEQRDEDGIGVVREPSPSADLQDLVRDAAVLCPASAIAVDDE
jgi:ferredoxin